MQRDQLFWIWLSEALGAANRDFKTLISLYDGPYELFHAEEEELDRIENISPRTRQRISDKSLVQANAILDACEKMGIGLLPYGDAAYPVPLKELRNPPVLLYYSGTLSNFEKTLCVGMVGTRRMSAYGMESAYKIAYELATAGATVVSGMAAGIDGVCSAAALAAGGKTVAVLGCGLDIVYPKHHKTLMEEIRKNGLLLSEYPPGTRPMSYHFPLRNRLISGLTRGTVVVEAGIGSGSLITAKEAILQGKDVFALPANVGSEGAEGTNGLLRDGAHLVLSAKDILAPYQFVFAGTLSTERLPKTGSSVRADLHYLERMGVISLTKRVAVSEAAVQAAEPSEPKRKKQEPTPSENAGSRIKEPMTAVPHEHTEKADIRKSKPKQESTEQLRTESSAERKQPSDEMLSAMTEQQLAILRAIPDDRAITADELCEAGMSLGDVNAALTILEILGLIQKLPGAMYIKT